MSRYIDADQLIKNFLPMGIGDGMYVINAKAIKFAIDNTPTADVVPKSEVEELKAIIADHKANEERMEELYSNTKAEVKLDFTEEEIMRSLREVGIEVSDKSISEIKAETAREIFEEIERTLDNYHCSSLLVGEICPTSYYDAELEDAIAELKKKYTEEKE